jgi:hypothetical protein
VDATREIQEIVERETRAWDTQDVELLLSVFHPEMVWPWPKGPAAHDPADWTLVLGRFDAERCKTYARLAEGWKMTMQTGALRYGDDRNAV